MSKPKLKPPPSLGDAGGAVWTEIVGKYDLRADELVVLEVACKTADMIATLDESWTELGRPFLTRGSMGQDVIHPLIGERRAQQAQLAALLGKLKLPDEAAPGAEQNQHRAAAAARWQHGS